MQRWRLTLAFLTTYLLVFHIWNSWPWPNMILSTAIIFSLILFFNFKVGIKKHYFVSTADKIAHLVIIANILIEGSIHALTMQEGDKIGYDFYFHALGYVVVIGLYRFFMLSTQHVSAKKEPEK